MIHIHYCRHAESSQSEVSELARRIERGDNGYYGVNGNSTPVHVKTGSPEAALCIEALRRL